MARERTRTPKPKYEGPTINVTGMQLEEKRELCRFALARTVRKDPSGGVMGSLVVGAERNYLINLGGTGASMNGVEQAAYAALHPSVAQLVDGWLAWKTAPRAA